LKSNFCFWPTGESDAKRRVGGREWRALSLLSSPGSVFRARKVSPSASRWVVRNAGEDAFACAGEDDGDGSVGRGHRLRERERERVEWSGVLHCGWR